VIGENSFIFLGKFIILFLRWKFVIIPIVIISILSVVLCFIIFLRVYQYAYPPNKYFERVCTESNSSNFAADIVVENVTVSI